MDKDTSTLLREIKAATGWSEPRIAGKLGTSQPTVNRIINGQADCKGSTLRAIINLHRALCTEGKPIVGATSSTPSKDNPTPDPDPDDDTPPTRDNLMGFGITRPPT